MPSQAIAPKAAKGRLMRYSLTENLSRFGSIPVIKRGGSELGNPAENHRRGKRMTEQLLLPNNNLGFAQTKSSRGLADSVGRDSLATAENL